LDAGGDGPHNLAVDLLRVEPTGPGAFRLVGELDISNVQSLRRMLEEQLRQGKQLNLDTKGLAFIDSEGLKLLIDLGKQAAEQGSTVRVLNCSRQFRQLLDIAVPRGVPGVDVINLDQDPAE
jgi:anti-anti-sigma factor